MVGYTFVRRSMLVINFTGDAPRPTFPGSLPTGTALEVSRGNWNCLLGSYSGQSTSNSPSLAPSTNASHSAGVKISVSESTGFSELRIAT